MAKKKSNSLIDPRYCCLAIPMVNAGIYAIIAEQTAVAIAVGVLGFVAPSVPGAATPKWVAYILSIVCFVGVAVQPVGFFGVFREKTKTFRIYSFLNLVITLCALIVALVIVVVSAARHSTAVAKCIVDYFTPLPSQDSDSKATLASEGQSLCNAFAWADVGFMGGLWVILFLTQMYFAFSTFRYSKSQVSDHKLYHSVYSENPEAFTMSILQSRRYNPDSVAWTHSMMNANPPPLGDAWDARPSYDSARHEPGPDAGGGYYGHQRGYSDGLEYPPGGEPGQHTQPHDSSHMAYPHGHSHLNPGAEHHPADYAFNAPGTGYADPSVAEQYRK